MELRVSSRRIFRPLLALLLIGSAGVFSAAKAQTQPKAPDTMEARVQGCTACHGSHGQGTDNDYFPRLAGKPADYLYNQLQNFREGRRKYPPMNYLVTYLSDDYLHQIATYFSQQRPPYPTPAKPTVSASIVERGQQIVLNGDASKTDSGLRGLPRQGADRYGTRYPGSGRPAFGLHQRAARRMAFGLASRHRT